MARFRARLAWLPLLVLAAAAASLAFAQKSAPSAVQVPRLRVYSEFTRLDPYGALVDSRFHPREILSPAVPRNAWSSFRIAITLPPATAYSLHVGQNPDDAARVTVYRERFTRRPSDGRWIPARLERVDLPFHGGLPDPASGIAGQNTETFWMDLFVSAGAPVRRVKIEPEIEVNGRWILYPMEVRVVEAAVPPAPSWGAALIGFREFYCGEKEIPPSPGTPGYLLRRNRAQDVLLLRKLEDARGATLVEAQVAGLLGAQSQSQWCQARPPADPEWILPVRDFLLRGPGFR